MRLLVCGGRDFDAPHHLNAVLDQIHSATPVTVLMHGAARGADWLAGRWARCAGVEVIEHPARWGAGRAAGVVRNARMLSEGRPDLVVAFAGGRGTLHMVSIARAAGVPVRIA